MMLQLLAVACLYIATNEHLHQQILNARSVPARLLRKTLRYDLANDYSHYSNQIRQPGYSFDRPMSPK